MVKSGKPTPLRLVVSVEGGIVQNIDAGPGVMEVVLVDHDIDGVPDEEIVSWRDGVYGEQRARVFEFVVEQGEQATKWVRRAFKLAKGR